MVGSLYTDDYASFHHWPEMSVHWGPPSGWSCLRRGRTSRCPPTSRWSSERRRRGRWAWGWWRRTWSTPRLTRVSGRGLPARGRCLKRKSVWLGVHQVFWITRVIAIMSWLPAGAEVAPALSSSVQMILPPRARWSALYPLYRRPHWSAYWPVNDGRGVVVVVVVVVVLNREL